MGDSIDQHNHNNTHQQHMHILKHGTELEVALFLEKNANAIGKYKQPIIFDVVLECKTERLKLILDIGFDINARDYDGNTLLHWAVLAGDLKAAEFFTSRGLSFETKNLAGKSPIDMARNILDGGYTLKELTKIQETYETDIDRTLGP